MFLSIGILSLKFGKIIERLWSSQYIKNQRMQEWGCAKRILYPGVEGSHGTHAIHGE